MKITSNGITIKSETTMNRSEKTASSKTTSTTSDKAVKPSPSDTLSLSQNVRSRGEITQRLITAQNDLSTLQNADEALSKIQSIVQQGKDLSIQASTSHDPAEKQAFQHQIALLNEKIDHISNSIQPAPPIPIERYFASEKDNKDIIYALKTSWLAAGEKVIQDRYGLSGDGADLNVVLDQGREPYLAAVYYNYTDEGKATNQVMHIAVQTALPATLPNGGSNPGQYDDRVITHEMVHAIMGRTMNVSELPTWFQEGTAEFIHGPNERVFYDLYRSGGGLEGAERLQDALGDGTNTTWVNNSLHYSSASLAVRYLHEKIKEDGHSGGIRDLLTDLKNNPTESLDQALPRVSHYGNVNEFVSDFVRNGNGAAFIHKLDQHGEFIGSILGGDTGAIGGANTDNGFVQNAQSVIPDKMHTTDAPLKSFHVVWPDPDSITIPKNTVQGTTVDYARFKMDSNALNTTHVDLLNNPNEAITIFDRAIDVVSNKQAELKQTQKHLHIQANEMSAAVNQSDIKDSSMVKETFAQIKSDLSIQSSTVITSLAKPQPERVLQLLKTNNY